MKMIRFFSVLAAILLFGYIVIASVILMEKRPDTICHDLEVVVKDSLEKHFINEQDLRVILKRAELDPVNQPMRSVNTERIEEELLKNQMISSAEVYKTPSGLIKLEVRQKLPVLRILSTGGNYYVDNQGSTMPVSPRYVAHVPVVSGYVEKELAMTDLYKFALFLQKNDFWNSQIEQIYVHPNKDVELIPRVGNHRIMMGSLDDFEEKLSRLMLFYKQVTPKMGWEKYSLINLKYRNQIVCTKK